MVLYLFLYGYASVEAREEDVGDSRVLLRWPDILRGRKPQESLIKMLMASGWLVVVVVVTGCDVRRDVTAMSGMFGCEYLYHTSYYEQRIH